MEFKINNRTWRIEEKSKQELINMYNEQYEEAAYFVFGLTLRPKHLIYINKEMCKDQKIKTLKHELTHCYIWEYGLYNVPNFNEEMVCDLVSSSNDFINEVVNQYLGIEPLYLCDKDKNTECNKKYCGKKCNYTTNIEFAKTK